jgi:hypothetical protein
MIELISHEGSGGKMVNGLGQDGPEDDDVAVGAEDATMNDVPTEHPEAPESDDPEPPPPPPPPPPSPRRPGGPSPSPPRPGGWGGDERGRRYGV